MILQASIPRVAPKGILAALVLEVDTIPKPDGLGNRIPVEDSEQRSNNFEPHSTASECCLKSVRFQDRIPSVSDRRVVCRKLPNGRPCARNVQKLVV